MFFKLAFKNVTKSLRDYAVYFLTLTFGVCLFYVFNSIESHQMVLALSNSQIRSLETLVELMAFFSGFVAVTLGFLIVYANGFLIRRRKQELGVYMTLGMSRGRISRVLILETLFIGAFSLLAGLALGVFLSQGLSVLTAAMFEVNMTGFQFVFSPVACGKSVLYFGVIFLVVMVFNVWEVARLKLIDLLYAAKKTQRLRVRSVGASIVLFLISVALLAAAYIGVTKNGLYYLDWRLGTEVALGCAGTLLFFLSLSGFFLKVVKSNKSLYYKGLNMFVLRQLNARINTNFLSMSLICLMLFFTISVLSGGLGVAQGTNAQLRGANPYDLTLRSFGDFESPNGDMAARMEAQGVKLGELGIGWEQLDYHYDDAMTYAALLGITETIVGKEGEGIVMPSDAVTVLSYSQFNANMRLQGKPELKLEENQFAVLVDNEAMRAMLTELLPAGKKIVLNGIELARAPADFRTEALQSVGVSGLEYGTLIVPDAAAAALGKQNSVLNLQYRPGVDDDVFMEALAGVYHMAPRIGGVMWRDEEESPVGDPPFRNTTSRQNNLENARGNSAMITYVAVYLGLVFLIAGAAVLALQQLSDASDNTERYALLRRLGAESKMVSRALFTQVGVYFLLPLALAVVHSIVGIGVIHRLVLEISSQNMLLNMLPVAALVVVVYGGYFIATCLGCRAMLRTKTR